MTLSFREEVYDLMFQFDYNAHLINNDDHNIDDEGIINILKNHLEACNKVDDKSWISFTHGETEEKEQISCLVNELEKSYQCIEQLIGRTLTPEDLQSLRQNGTLPQ